LVAGLDLGRGVCWTQGGVDLGGCHSFDLLVDFDGLVLLLNQPFHQEVSLAVAWLQGKQTKLAIKRAHSGNRIEEVMCDDSLLQY